MSKELEALIRIEDFLNMLYETDVIDDDHTHDTNIIGEALKRLEELEKAFVALSKEDEKTKKLLSKEIEKNRVLEFIKKHILNRDTDTSGIYLEFHNGHYEPYYTIEIREGIKQIVSLEEYDLLKKEIVC